MATRDGRGHFGHEARHLFLSTAAAGIVVVVVVAEREIAEIHA
jgi:hypothetical protein